jgi:hypothetical protein
MRRATLLASICLVLVGFAVPAQAYTLTSREHRFSIELPGEPDYHGPRTIFLGDNEYTGLGWDYDNYSVHLFKLTPRMGGAQFLGNLISNKGRARCRVVESDKPIRQGRAAGRDALIRDTQWTHRHGCGFKRFSLRARGFVVGNRLYWVEYKTSSREEAMSPEVTRVFDSFRVLN